MKYSKTILTSSNETARNGVQKIAPAAARMAPAEYKAAAPGPGFIYESSSGRQWQFCLRRYVAQCFSGRRSAGGFI
jgi:hypothetical protein